MHVITPFKIKTPHGIVFSTHAPTKESRKSYEKYYHEMILPVKKLLAEIDAKYLKSKSNQKIKK